MRIVLLDELDGDDFGKAVVEAVSVEEAAIPFGVSVSSEHELVTFVAECGVGDDREFHA